jgi:Fur family ferric uptake transcriptional regulator
VTVAPRRPPVAVADLEEAGRAVRAAGGRLTLPRRAVLRALLAADAPVSAEQIAHGPPGADLVSVYRNLEWLEDLGLVRHIHVGHGAGLYELVRADGHEYLVCERCSALTAVEAGELDAARAEIGRVTGYEARFDHFPIHGLCAACLARDGAHT